MAWSSLRPSNTYLHTHTPSPHLTHKPSWAPPTHPLIKQGPTHPLIKLGPTHPLIKQGPTRPLIKLGPTHPLIKLGPTHPLIKLGPTHPLIKQGSTPAHILHAPSTQQTCTKLPLIRALPVESLENTASANSTLDDWPGSHVQ